MHNSLITNIMNITVINRDKKKCSQSKYVCANINGYLHKLSPSTQIYQPRAEQASESRAQNIGRGKDCHVYVKYAVSAQSSHHK